MCQIPDHRWHIQRILGRLQSCLSTSSKWHYTVMRTAGKYNIDNTVSRCWTSTAVAAHRFSSSIASIPWQTFNDLERTALRFLLRLCIDIPVKCSLRPWDSGKNCLSRLSRSSSDLKMDRNTARLSLNARSKTTRLHFEAGAFCNWCHKSKGPWQAKWMKSFWTKLFSCGSCDLFVASVLTVCFVPYVTLAVDLNRAQVACQGFLEALVES